MFKHYTDGEKFTANTTHTLILVLNALIQTVFVTLVVEYQILN